MTARRLAWLLAAAALCALGLARACRDDGAAPRAALDGAATSAASERARSDESGDRHARAGVVALATASLRGTIADRDGPLANARVCARAADHALDAGRTGQHCGATDARGAYVLGALPAATYTVSAVAPHHLPGDTTAIALRAGEARAGVDLVLDDGGVLLTGTISDRDGGPIAHAMVTGWSRTDVESAPVEADDSGHYELWTWPGSVYAVASADGYATESKEGTAPGEIDVELVAGGEITGVVIDAATRTPVANARVVVTIHADWVAMDRTPSARTDDDGHFAIAHLEPGRYVAAAKTEHGFGVGASELRVPLAGRADGAVIELHPAVAVGGTLRIAGTPPRPCPRPSLLLWMEHGTGVLDGHPAPGGALRADGVPPGTYSVYPRCDGYRVVADPPPLTVADRDLTDQVWDFVRGAVIRGHVRTSAGVAVAGAHVELENGGWNQTESTRDGSFELAGLDAGRYRVLVSAAAGTLATPPLVELADGATRDLELILVPGGTLAGTVTDADGQPVDGASVVASTDGGTHYTTSDHHGAFRFAQLAAGNYHIVTRRAHGEVTATIVAGETTTVALHTDEHRAALAGTVVSASGQPVPGALVTAWRWDYVGQTTTDRDGAFSFHDFDARPYTLQASHAGDGEASVRDATPGTPVRLQLRATGSLVGSVHLGSAPAADFLVEVDGRKQRFYQTGGQFTVDDLPAGTYRVAAYDNRDNRDEIAVEVPAASHASVDLALAPPVRVVGRAVDTQGHPIGHAYVWIARRDEGDLQATTAADGRFTLEPVRRGTTAITIVHRTEKTIEVMVDHAEFDVGDITLDDAQ